MKVVALISGGKDSCYAMMKCVEYGHEIVALANLMPSDDMVDELDSFMYQTVGHQIVVSYAKCMGLPLFRRRIKGSTRHQDLSYRLTPGDEVEDMFILLNEVKQQMPSITAVSSGAIASDYQRLRVESVCSRLGLISLAYLWKLEQSLLLQEMVTNGIKAILVKVAAIGLDPAKHLGKDVAVLNPYLHKLNEMYGINICGEGGEYETLTLDCPLFVNAQIMVDEFKVVLHSSDSIAPVGVLHPLKFHLEEKERFLAFNADSSGSSNAIYMERANSVVEVQGDCLQTCVLKPLDAAPVEIPEIKFSISRTKGENTFSMCFWLENSCRTSASLQEDLEVLLKKIELQLSDNGFCWKHVLYIHLYVADMKDFALANETYVRFITEERCPFGVPSRSTIELPLLRVGLGKAYVEVLVSNDQRKKVLHVQSISSWAPSCIGPYSQATMHKEILHMAGQLGLDPPTMTLCKGGLIAELKQALENSESVAETFNCSISTSTIQFTIFCSAHVPSSDRSILQEKLVMFLEEMRCLQVDEGSVHEVLAPISLYVHVPDLPKQASLEVKPILYTEQDVECMTETVRLDPSCTKAPSCWGFQQAHWHDSCLQKCVVHGKICAVVIHITTEFALKIFSESSASAQEGGHFQNPITDGQMERMAKFCIYLLDRILVENEFYWEDALNLRLYFPESLPLQSVLFIFGNAFNEFADLNQSVDLGKGPIFNPIPVLGSGKSAASMDDLITCELFARKQ